MRYFVNYFSLKRNKLKQKHIEGQYKADTASIFISNMEKQGYNEVKELARSQL